MFDEFNGKQWLIGVSGGPDSMALLDMAYEKGLNIHVAHVNYHKRDSADRDMNITLNYCMNRNIPCHVLNEPYTVEGNFQAFARRYRYSFYKECCELYGCEGVLVAHQLDDVLETYLMQKDKKLECDYFGLKDHIQLFDVDVYRPLLALTKKDCIDYCEMHHIEYGIDESNLTDDYTRNKIRHSLVEPMSLNEKYELLNEMNSLNEEIRKRNDAWLYQENSFETDWYLKLEENERYQYLRYICNKEAHIHLSKEHCMELDKALHSKKNFIIHLEDYVLHKSYGLCEVVGNCFKDYCYEIKSLYEFETKFFKVRLNGGNNLNGVTVKEDDFPLVIRNARDEDKILLRFGYKKLSRFFIDRKIDLLSRKIWPVVVNCKGEIILVPQIGADVNHFSIKHNLFVIK